MRVAVLMSTYNGEKYIREQIDSILSQECDCEIALIVRDDGSTDGTKALLDLYQNRNILKWYEGENVGPAKSFLDLLKKCKGYDFYAFADQDDIWKKGKIQKGVHTLSKKTGPNLYFSNAELVDAEQKSLNAVVYKRPPAIDFETMSCAGGVLGCTVVFNRELAEAIQNAESPRNVIMHDFYVAEVCLALGGEITYDSETNILYRQHANNTIGVAHGMISAIKDRIHVIIQNKKIGIAEQAEEILKIYDQELPLNSRIWLTKIARYKKNFINRIALAVSNKTDYGCLNASVTIRSAILMGNR